MTNTTNELLDKLYRLEWLLRYRHMRDRRERGPMGDPRRGQGRILALLKLQPEIDQRELALILDIRSQSLGELLAKLERQGYLTRSPSEADRRVMEIRLTETGKAAAGEPTPSQDAESLFGVLTEEEREALGGYLERLIDDWEKKQGAEIGDADFRMGPGGMGRGGPGGGGRGGPGRGGRGGRDGSGGPGGRGGPGGMGRGGADGQDRRCHHFGGLGTTRRGFVGQAWEA